MNPVKTNKHQYHVNNIHNRIVNKTKYNNSGKSMKQTSFTVKNL